MDEKPARRKLIADGRFMNDGVLIRRGEPFECSDEDASSMIAMGLAHSPGPDEINKFRATYRRRDMTAEK